jgi:hypothetical protein
LSLCYPWKIVQRDCGKFTKENKELEAGLERLIVGFTTGMSVDNPPDDEMMDTSDDSLIA